MNEPVRVLNLFTIMDRGGAESMVMNYYRNIDRSKLQFDFMVHREEHGAYDDEIESLGGKIYRMPGINPWESKKYRKIIKNFYLSHPEYRIVHSHMSELGYYDFIEAKNANIPNIICHAHNRPHGFDLKSPVRWYYKTRMRPYLTHMFTCGEESGKWLFGEKYANSYIQMNNAIDAKKFSFNQALRKNTRDALDLNDKFVLGHIGRFAQQKNHSFLLDVFCEIKKQIPQSVLLLVGDDSTETGSFIHNKVQNNSIKDSVMFLGSRDDIPDLLQAMDVFVFPSLFEGFGIAALEAQASGLPCLVSEFVPDECLITNLITRMSLNESAKKWSDKLIEISRIPRRNTYQEIVDAGFDIKENAKWLQDFYLSLVNGG